MSAVATPTPPGQRTRFPDAVWDVPLLRALDARARSEIELAGRLRKVSAGETIHRAGDPADMLLVLADGACTVHAIRRGDTTASVIRKVSPGEIFGEEAIVTTFATRAFDARSDSGAVVAEIPVAVLRRAVGRGDRGEVVLRLERALRRAATIDLVRTTSFGRRLGDRELDLVVDAARHVHLARGEKVSDVEAFFVADGLLSAQSDDDGRPRIEAYLSRGDLFDDDRLCVVATGPSWIVAVPRTIVQRMAPGARRLTTDALAKPPPAMHTTAHVFRDVYRMRVARSLLVIDQDSCIRCGHCAWSCASVHDDGLARLVRQGDKVIVRSDGGAAPLLVPNSCQHCKNPACMIDCPTGAIGRDARGEVFIREDLCTGCGACAKACPWDNIQIARRKDATTAPFPDVAVKCDLCADRKGGPACVSACPTQAIARVDPNEAFVELGVFDRRAPKPAASPLPKPMAAWPWIAGASAAALGLALSPLGRWPSGIVAGVLALLLVAYSGAKRAPRLLARANKPALARVLYVAHASLGAIAFGATIAHTGAKMAGNAAGALFLAFALTIATGACGAVVNTFVPRLLARLERKSVLPEDLAARARDLDEHVFEKLSGKGELVKTLFAKVLRPYRRARLGALRLAFSTRSLREEEKRVRASIDRLLDGRRAADRLAGMDDLVKLVVERRAVGAQAILTALLRGWLPIHLAATAMAVVLLFVHVIAVRGRP